MKQEFNIWLSKVDFAKEVAKQKKFKIMPPSKQEQCLSSQANRTNIVNPPLSLENNSTLTVTAVIFEEFGREFSIPCPQACGIPFNASEKKFDIMSARTQFDFMKSVAAHQNEMVQLERQMRSAEKEIDGLPQDIVSPDSDSDKEDEESGHSESVTEEKLMQEKKDEAFQEQYNKIEKKVQQAKNNK